MHKPRCCCCPNCPVGQERNANGDCAACPANTFSNGGSKCVPCNAKADVWITYDGSGSMSKDGKWGSQKRFLKQLLADFDVSPTSMRVGSNQYNSKSRLNWEFSAGDTVTELTNEAATVSQRDTNSCAYCS